VIEGVSIKNLVTHPDDRGFFRELVRSTDPFFGPGFGQLSHSLVYAGVVKAWHAHRSQVQWTYVTAGTLKVVLHDFRAGSPTFRETMEFLLGDDWPPAVYAFPPGVAHGYVCVKGPAHVLYLTSGTYDLEDEIRIPHDDPSIGYDWSRSNRIR
jgi:dTDP-4-dehydrorhamnose 3,5-epimerase